MVSAANSGAQNQSIIIKIKFNDRSARIERKKLRRYVMLVEYLKKKKKKKTQNDKTLTFQNRTMIDEGKKRKKFCLSYTQAPCNSL